MRGMLRVYERDVTRVVEISGRGERRERDEEEEEADGRAYIRLRGPEHVLSVTNSRRGRSQSGEARLDSTLQLGSDMHLRSPSDPSPPQSQPAHVSLVALCSSLATAASRQKQKAACLQLLHSCP